MTMRDVGNGTKGDMKGRDGRGQERERERGQGMLNGRIRILEERKGELVGRRRRADLAEGGRCYDGGCTIPKARVRASLCP